MPMKCTIPIITVKQDQITTASIIESFEPIRSVSHPEGIRKITYAQLNAENRYPISTELIPSSLLMSVPATDSAARSPVLRARTMVINARIRKR
ncbi:hypothetical protein D3C85_1475240 [compost metagenome]